MAAGASATAARSIAAPAARSPERSSASPRAARALVRSSCARSVCGVSGFALTNALRRSTRAAASSLTISSSSAFSASSFAGLAAAFDFPAAVLALPLPVCPAGLRCAVAVNAAADARRAATERLDNIRLITLLYFRERLLPESLGQHAPGGARGRLDVKDARERGRDVGGRRRLEVAAGRDAAAHDDERDVRVVPVGRAVRGARRARGEILVRQIGRAHV